MNPNMVDYARRVTSLDSFQVGDMQTFEGDVDFDAVWVLLNTLAHTTSLPEFLATVSRALRPGGVCILEMFSAEDIKRFKSNKAIAKSMWKVSSSESRSDDLLINIVINVVRRVLILSAVTSRRRYF